MKIFPNITIDDWEFGLEFKGKPADRIQNLRTIFNWGQLQNGDKKLCLYNEDNSMEVTFYDCIVSTNLEFEYATDYTIRKLQSNQCLRVNDDKAFLEPCTSDSMRWGLNEMTRQMMEVQSIKYLEKHDAGDKWQIRL